MAKDTLIEVAGTELVEHPAFRAWQAVAPGCDQPARITILKQTRDKTVYRLDGVGPGGGSVIAKRCRPDAAATERIIYSDVLPHLPIAAIRLYGFLEDRDRADGQQCWLFLEDAGDEPYSYLLNEHRVLAGQWLGRLHSGASHFGVPAVLPDRGPDYYLRLLRSSREVMGRNLANPALHGEGARTLADIVTQYGVLEAHWSDVVRICREMPQTLVHGDLAPKNARVRVSSSGSSLVVIDWGGVGWGVPAIDLAQFTAQSLSPNLAAYSAVVPSCWTELRRLSRMAELGKIFRLIVAMSWESLSLSGQWLVRPARNLRLYRAAMADCIREAGWED